MSPELSLFGARTSLSTTLSRRFTAGVLGGLAGGMAFGTLMAMMGMLVAVASIFGSHSPFVGFAMHLMISVLFGLGLTVPFGSRFLTEYRSGVLVGSVYGVIWWVLGPFVTTTLMLGMPVLNLDMTSVFSLMGHLFYGAIMGLVAVRVLTARA